VQTALAQCARPKEELRLFALIRVGADVTVTISAFLVGRELG
jgi:hypothetical protein